MINKKGKEIRKGKEETKETGEGNKDKLRIAQNYFSEAEHFFNRAGGYSFAM